jgi:hypothetical protein
LARFTRHQVRHFHAARPSPRRPKIQQGDFSARVSSAVAIESRQFNSGAESGSQIDRITARWQDTPANSDYCCCTSKISAAKIVMVAAFYGE